MFFLIIEKLNLLSFIYPNIRHTVIQQDGGFLTTHWSSTQPIQSPTPPAVRSFAMESSPAFQPLYNIHNV